MRADGPALSGIRFEEVAAEVGVSFRFDAGGRGRRDLPEIMGGGVGLIDLDGDGRLDLFFCQGGPIEGTGPDPTCRLFRNQGDGTFADVTARAGVPGPSYAMGVAVGDHDADGRDDLFVTGWRDQRLYRNNGDGTFADVTERAGLTSDLWSTSAAFADLDGDGDLDLYACGYLDYDPTRAPFCAAPDGRRDYCGPEDFPAQPDRLYRNNGDGTFTDRAGEAGVSRPGGRGLGVLAADLVGDPLPDLFVANDGSPCWLFENLGGLTFREVGLETGVALDGAGEALAAMGVALGDLNGDRRAELVVTNFLGRSTVAFRPDGAGRFADASAALGLRATTRDVLGFGVAVEDLDGDGRPDLLQANGHVLDRARLGTPFAMRPTLLAQRDGRLIDAAGPAGAWFARPILGRGLAVGDLDGDARPDAVVAALDAPAALLRNTSTGGRFAALELIGSPPAAGRPGGARIEAEAGGRGHGRQVVGGGSYLSAPAPTVFLGLGDARAIDRIEVRWPSGRVETWRALAAGATHRLVEGRGAAR